MNSKHTPTPKGLMVFLDGLDACVDGRGWNSEHEKAKDYVFRALNSHETMLNLLKGFVENLDLNDRHDVAQFSALVYKAIAQAEKGE